MDRKQLILHIVKAVADVLEKKFVMKMLCYYGDYSKPSSKIIFSVSNNRNEDNSLFIFVMFYRLWLLIIILLLKN